MINVYVRDSAVLAISNKKGSERFGTMPFCDLQFCDVLGRIIFNVEIGRSGMRTNSNNIIDSRDSSCRAAACFPQRTAQVMTHDEVNMTLHTLRFHRRQFKASDRFPVSIMHLRTSTFQDNPKLHAYESEIDTEIEIEMKKNEMRARAALA